MRGLDGSSLYSEALGESVFVQSRSSHGRTAAERQRASWRRETAWTSQGLVQAMFASRHRGTVIAKGLKIVGSVTAEGLVEVNGQVDGELHCTSLMSLEPLQPSAWRIR
jgi:hypothetical protein